MNTKARIRDWLEAADFNGEGCAHSYLTIALANGCSERHAVRLVHELEAETEVDIDRAPRGSKRPNVYRVRNRNPRLRAPVLSRLAEVRKLRRELCQSKGTAAPRGLNRPGKDRSLYVVDQRRGRARAANNLPKARFERSRGVSEPARAPSTLRVVGCAECERYRRVIDALEVDLQNAEVSLRSERRQKNEAKAQARHLKNEREREAKETPNIELIERLWGFWKLHVRPNARKLDLKTIEAVRARLADTLPESDEPAYTPRYVAEAILGAKYEAYTNRAGKRFDALELVCRSSKHLEDFHERYERHQGGGLIDGR